MDDPYFIGILHLMGRVYLISKVKKSYIETDKL